MKILFIGDIIGSLGRTASKELLPQFKEEFCPDLTIANGENSAHGYGITAKIYDELILSGIDAITMGNHVWDKKEVIPDFDRFRRLTRPANYPKGAPGREYLVVEAKDGTRVGIINLVGRTFMPPLDCPFQAVERLLPQVKKEAPVVIVDMHAEASSEKCAMGWYLDGRVTAVVGTHTHVMTADERILPQGTAFITDVGMVGARDSIIGMNKEQILKRFLSGMHDKFEPTEAGIGLFNAILLQINPNDGKAEKIERIIRTTGEILHAPAAKRRG